MRLSSSKWIAALVLVVIGIIALVYIYTSHYKILIEENNKLKDDIALNEKTYSALLSYDLNKTKYQNDIDVMKKNVSDILSVFPVEIRVEDELLYTEYLEEKLGYKIESLSVGNSYSLYSMSNGNTLCAQYITVPYSTDYEGFKELITFFNSDNKTGSQYPASIVTLDISHDDEGVISGTMVLRRYYVVGQDSEYVPPKIPDGMFEIGIDELFGK